ncbi:MAG: choice-of-anchor D domain-containing protein [Saprospiraceae bacterium]|nr:choice-of-anchor D domain-containing protein [Saprospiraceae bacterium]
MILKSFLILFAICAMSNFSFGQASIDILGNTTLIANGQTSISTNDYTNFGSERVCYGTTTHTFTVQNSGNIPLNINSISSSNPNFTILSAPTSIAVGSSDVFTVGFDPSINGSINSTITIANSDVQNDPFIFNIEGIGITPSTDIVRGTSTNFDGIDDYIDCGMSINNKIDNQTNFTVEAWVNLNNVTGQYNIISNSASGVNNGFELIVNNGVVYFTYRDNTGSIISSPTLPISAGEWHHVAGVLNTTSINVYVDGIKAGNSIMSTGIKPSTYPLIIGGNSTLGTFNIDGKIDEIRIWEVSRDYQQIRENIHLSLDGCENGLVAYYQCNSTGSTLINNLGTGHNGTLVNGTIKASSEINLGNDVSGNSTSETIASIPGGVSLQNFNAANLSMNFVRHSGFEDVTVTYQAFTPNTTNGSSGVLNLDNSIWTVNKSSKTEDMLVDYTFIFPPNTLTSTEYSKYGLYWRAMNQTGDWTKISTAHSATTNSVGFGKIALEGQFMVVQESETMVSDVRGNMYEFDGIDDYINVTNTPSFNFETRFSLECWFKTNTISNTNKVLIAKEVTDDAEGFTVSVANNNIYFNFPGIGSLTSNGIQLNQWHHVVAVFDFGNAYLYLDGVLVSTGFFEYNFNTTENLYIGARHLNSGGGNIEHFDGAIDEVRIWNTVRTQNEIRENIHLTLRGNEPGLIAYYQFNNDLSVGTTDGVIDAMSLSNGSTLGMNNSNYLGSEAAVAGGRSDRTTIPASGPLNVYFTNTDVKINFNSTTPNGEIVVYRLETEKPHGWNTIGGDVDNEYFIVKNFGANQSFNPLIDLTFNRLNYISQDDVALIQSASPLKLFKRGSNDYGATWGNSQGGAESTIAGSVGSATYDPDNNLTSFSQFVIVNFNNNSLMSVELLDFEAERKDVDNVEISWTTSSEKNSIGFHVEVMYDGSQEFKSISYSDANGNANTGYAYNINHSNSFPGVSYYRLKIMNYDGSFSFSEIKAVEGKGETASYVDLTFYPNPVQETLKVRFDKLSDDINSTVIQIINLNGKVIRESTRSLTSYEVLEINNISDLSPSVYLISLNLDNGQNIVKRFIKM